MLPNLPPQLLPYAAEYERLLVALVSLETQDGSSWFAEGEASDLLKEADLVSRAYIEYTQKHSGFHDRYFTNLAKYLVELSENLTKRRAEDPQVTPPLSYTFTLKEDRPATGATVGVILIDALERICERIQELKLEEFVEKRKDIVELQARKKGVLMDRIKELYDMAFSGDVADPEGSVKLAKSTLEAKRDVSANLSTEPELDQLVWRCHVVERFLGDVHEMMDRDEEDKKVEFWKPSTLEWCQITCGRCEGLKEEVEKYLDLHPGSLLSRHAPPTLPVIMPNELIGRSYQKLSTEYSNALKGFIGLVAGAMKDAEDRKLKAEVECVLTQHLLDLRERQLAKQNSAYAAVTPKTPSAPPLSVPLLLEETKSYSLDNYVKFVVDLRLKEARRIYVLSEVWNQHLNWTRGRESRIQHERRSDLGLFDPTVQEKLKQLISDGRDPTRPSEPLGWWVSED